ncbi:MAG: sialate O-acetylesterase [Planctomycetota bacterium]|jgi:hypothetical protein
MKARVLFLVASLLFSQDIFAQNPNFHIYLCFGQSNMQGSAPIEAQDKENVNDRFKVLQSVDCSNLKRIKGKWVKAEPPLCRCETGLGPADYFGRTMVANLEDRITVGVINVAVAGCRIELFDKEKYRDFTSTHTEDWFQNIIQEYGGNPYAHLIGLAKRAQQDGVIKGILLHQGESNTGDKEWPLKVKTVYDNLIRDLELNPKETPLLAGEVVHADQGGICARMNSIIAKLPETVLTSYVISSKGCLAKDDNLHFTSEGYRMLGKRYAFQMLKVMGIEVSEKDGSRSEKNMSYKEKDVLH